MAIGGLLITIRLRLRSGGPEARSSRGGGAPRERPGVGPRPQTQNADKTPLTIPLLLSSNRPEAGRAQRASRKRRDPDSDDEPDEAGNPINGSHPSRLQHDRSPSLAI